MHLRAVLVTFLVVLAGCSGFPEFGQETQTQTVTPVELPEEEATAATTVPPPGISHGTITNLSALALAHRNYVRNHSYVWKLRYIRVFTSDGDVVQRHVRNETVWVQQTTIYREEIYLGRDWLGSRVGPTQRISVYANGTHKHARIREGNRTTYLTTRLTDRSDQFSEIARFSIQQHLRVRNISITAVQDDGKTYYRIVGYNSTGYWYQGTRNYTTVAYVEPSGLVRNLTVTYERPQQREGYATFQFNYSHIDNVTVEQPSWVTDRETNGTITEIQRDDKSTSLFPEREKREVTVQHGPGLLTGL